MSVEYCDDDADHYEDVSSFPVCVGSLSLVDMN